MINILALKSSLPDFLIILNCSGRSKISIYISFRPIKSFWIAELIKSFKLVICAAFFIRIIDFNNLSVFLINRIIYILGIFISDGFGWLPAFISFVFFLDLNMACFGCWFINYKNYWLVNFLTLSTLLVSSIFLASRNALVYKKCHLSLLKSYISSILFLWNSRLFGLEA